ncbi:MAG: von Willebrand factor type A domain-containing protein, partial [Wenzhouxiangellaceae bacterium]
MNNRQTRISLFTAAFAFTLLLGACTQPETQPESETAKADKHEEWTQPIPQPREQRPVTPSQEADAATGQHLALDRATVTGSRLREAGQFTPPGNIRLPDRPVDRENYTHFDDNPVKRVAEHPVSTFSIDVDTGSYANIRRMLRAGRLPPEDAVRVEELINYFSYDYPVPEAGDTPFSVSVEQAVTPWNPNTRLLQVGIQGYRPDRDDIPASNLVFLVDVSGSMHSDDKLPLLKNSLKMLTRQLDADDRIAIVVYAGATGVVLESTPGDRHATISGALDQLSAGGPTNG